MVCLIAGAALLGNWLMYKPVFYRLYYEPQAGKRRSLLALSRLGFFAVTAALAYKRGADKAILTIIAPLTLATIGKEKLSSVVELLRNPSKLCSHIVKGLEDTVSLVKVDIASGKDGADSLKRCEEKNVATKIIDVAIRYDGSKREIAVRGFADKYKCIKEDNAEIASNLDIVVVKKLKCSSDSESCVKVLEDGLPIVCSYRCKLDYEVSYYAEYEDGEKKPILQEKSIDIETYIVIVPVAMAQRLRDDTVVVFRERNPDKLDMESALRASVLEGLAASLVHAISREVSSVEEADITFFYDTTHGVNALLSPFSYAINIADQLAILRLTEKLLESYTSNKDFTYKVRSYLYNSDPVQLRMPDEIKHVMVTLESNISYYYRTLIEESELSTRWREIGGKEARKQLRGILKSIAGVKSVIDEFVSYLPSRDASDNEERSVESNATFYMQLMYLAKLGMPQWAIAASYFNSSGGLTSHGDSLNSPPELEPVIKFRAKPNNNILEVSYELNKQDEQSSTPPHINVTSILLGKGLASYMLALYKALEGTSAKRDKLCFRIDTLEKMLKDIDSKLGAFSAFSATSGETSEKPALDKRMVPPLIASAIYTEMVEPGARTLMLNELGKLGSENLEKMLDHFLPRGFKLSIEKCPSPSEAWEQVLEAKAMCVYPMSLLPPKSEHVRNFIAHGGLTRLSRDWCLALRIKEDKDKGYRCMPYAICIEKPLSREIMNAIIRSS